MNRRTFGLGCAAAIAGCTIPASAAPPTPELRKIWKLVGTRLNVVRMSELRAGDMFMFEGYQVLHEAISNPSQEDGVWRIQVKDY